MKCKKIIKEFASDLFFIFVILPFLSLLNFMEEVIHKDKKRIRPIRWYEDEYE